MAAGVLSLGVINKMLAGALQGSHAHFRGQTVLIECDKPIFLEILRSNDFYSSEPKVSYRRRTV